MRRLLACAAGLGLLAGAAAPALAAEYRSTAADAVLMYDAPSAKAKKLFVASRRLPLEVLVVLEAWVKVRDAMGDIAWVEKKHLSEARHLVVTAAEAEVRAAPQADAQVVFRARRDVALELVETVAAGWARVKHPDGQDGFVAASQVWGL